MLNAGLAMAVAAVGESKELSMSPLLNSLIGAAPGLIPGMLNSDTGAAVVGISFPPR